MKIFGLDVPLPLVDLYNEYVSKQKNFGGNNYEIRRRRRAGRIVASKSARKILIELKWAVSTLADQLGYEPNTQERADFVFAREEELQDGIVNELYWTPAPVMSDAYYQCSASNVQDPNPPPYYWRNPYAMPSIPTYSAGSPGAAPARSSGAVVSNLWNDQSWTYRHKIFEIRLVKNSIKQTPLLWASNGTITIQASTRGSRPMASILMRAHIVKTPSEWDGDTTPPAQPATSFYWRYPAPLGTPPYYNVTIARKIVCVLNYRATIEDENDITRVIVKSSVRAMLGRGYNNNTLVNTSYNGTSDLYALISKLAGNYEFLRGTKPTTYQIFASATSDKGTVNNWGFYTRGGGVQRWVSDTQFLGFKFAMENTTITEVAQYPYYWAVGSKVNQPPQYRPDPETGDDRWIFIRLTYDAPCNYQGYINSVMSHYMYLYPDGREEEYETHGPNSWAHSMWPYEVLDGLQHWG